jgi:hypothetical protein
MTSPREFNFGGKAAGKHQENDKWLKQHRSHQGNLSAFSKNGSLKDRYKRSQGLTKKKEDIRRNPGGR